MKISIVAALTSDHKIGLNGRLPWHSSRDMERFRELTWGKPCIMGRKTWYSFPGLLEGRRNIVLSARRGPHEGIDGLEISLDGNDALSSCNNSEEVMIIGGSEVYATYLDMADTIYLTWVLGRFDGDTYFPQFNFWEWTLKEQQLSIHCKPSPNLIFETWERNI